MMMFSDMLSLHFCRMLFFVYASILTIDFDVDGLSLDMDAFDLPDKSMLHGTTSSVPAGTTIPLVAATPDGSNTISSNASPAAIIPYADPPPPPVTDVAVAPVVEQRGSTCCTIM